MTSSRSLISRVRRPRRLLRSLALSAVLATTLYGVPDASVNDDLAALVAVPRATGLDVTPETIWILAVGSDARPGQPILRSRGDAIQLVGINTRTGAATAIGIPRDSYVDVPGHGRERINAGLYFGGPQLMARAVQGLVGIEPDYVFVASFWNFETMIDGIGGVEVHSVHAFSDPELRPRGFRKGRTRVDGRGALAFSRIRKDLPAGDFDRSANQQRTLRAILAKVRAGADRPGFIEEGVRMTILHMHTNLGPRELYRIGHAVAQVDPRRLSTCVIPGGVGNAGAASVVFPNVSVARRYGNDARHDAKMKC